MVFKRPVRNWQRWREVQAILVRYGFDILIDKEEIQDVRTFLRDKLHLQVGKFDNLSLPERVRLMLTDLGPTYVKLGQVLSSRTDLLPDEWIVELSKLQDDVSPFPYDAVQKIIEDSFGQPLRELFLEFNPVPIAAASIGQVHQAVLPNLNKVVVKIQRPGVRDQVAADMEILRELARLIESRLAWGRRYGVTSIVEEFSRTLNLEMDYTNEAANADRLRKNMLSQSKVHVPYIYWDLVSDCVLTMEAVEGIKITQLERLSQEGVDRAAVADVFIRSIFRQLMIDGFFHADPHPGNLFVVPETQLLVYLDLGMMGSLLPDQRTSLGDIVQAILQRDSSEVVRLIMMIGTAYEPVNLSGLQREIDRIVARYLDAPLERISFAQLMADILQTIFAYHIRLPSEFSLAIKTLIQAEGVARQLDPKIVIMDVLHTISQQIWMQRLDPKVVSEQVSFIMREAVRLGQAIPKATESLLRQMEKGALKVGLDIPDFRQQVNHFYIISNRLTAGLIIAGMIIGSAIAMGVPPTKSWIFVPILGVIGFSVSMIIGGMLVWSVFLDMWRSGRNRNHKS